MKILIIEDEPLSATKLQRMICQHTPSHTIVGVCDSIVSSVKWLTDNECDIIFCDVQLSDGLCFEIFRQVHPRAKIVVTTAYDQYAIAAFKIGSVDYLLKPIETGEFITTMERIAPFVPMEQRELDVQMEQLDDVVQSIKMRDGDDLTAHSANAGRYKKRFTVRVGDKILIVEVADVAYFLSEDKFTTIVLKSGRRHISELTLDFIEEVVDPAVFFRITRGCIVNIEAIKSVSRYQASRLKVSLMPSMPNDEPSMLVSRKRMPEFIRWIEG